MKVKKVYRKGGKMKKGASKKNPAAPTRMTLGQAVQGSRKVEPQNMSKADMAKQTTKPRRKFDNGGKVKNKRTAQSDTLERTKEQVLENARLEERNRGADGPGRSEYINQEKAAQGPLKKLKPKKASPIASKPLPAKKLKKSKAVIPVPPAKGRRRRRNRK